MTSVLRAFKSARKDALRHMAASERANYRWGETTITEIVNSRAARAVHVVTNLARGVHSRPNLTPFRRRGACTSPVLSVTITVSRPVVVLWTAC